MSKGDVLARVRLVAAIWGGSLLLVPGSSGGGLLADAMLFAAWGLVLLASVLEGKAAAITSAGAGTLFLAVWAVEPRVFVASTLLLAFALALGALLGPKAQRRVRTTLLTVAPVTFPFAIGALSWTLGEENVRNVLRQEWVLPPLAVDTVSIFARWMVIQAGAWLVLAWAEGGRRRAGRVVVAVAATGLFALAAWRVGTLATLVTVPGDAQWSEGPALMTLLKLDVGGTLFGPLEDCNSYLYSPVPELVHHVLLRPFGVDLSLLANRCLVVVWQCGTAAALFWLFRRAAREAEVKHGGISLAAFALVVALSSFLAPNLHPDHMLMPAFAVAIALVVHHARLPPRVVAAILVTLPMVAALVKLTGAGIGVGLVLALARPSRRRDVVLLAAGGLLAVVALGVAAKVFPGFLTYTLGIQSSHPVRWDELPRAVVERPARVAIAAVLALGTASLVVRRPGGATAADAERLAAGRRVALLTLGFAMPSMIAYLKVGGRVNSLLPLSIGGASVLVVLSWSLARRGTEGAALAVLGWLWVAFTVTPPQAPVVGAFRTQVVRRHERAVALIRAETAAGHRTLFYEGVAPWLEAGRRDVPLDRPQTVSELVLGHHPAAGAHFARLADGTYDTIIVSDRFLDPRRVSFAKTVQTILAERYEVTGPPDAADSSLSPFVVHRWRGAPVRPTTPAAP